jgi:hypothetical protein
VRPVAGAGGDLLNFWSTFRLVIVVGSAARGGLSNPVAIILVALGIFGFVCNLVLFRVEGFASGAVVILRCQSGRANDGYPRDLDP